MGCHKAAGDDKHRLTALEGLAALSLDALSSVAYGPEAIVIVLVAAGTVGLSYALPVTAAIVSASRWWPRSISFASSRTTCSPACVSCS